MPKRHSSAHAVARDTAKLKQLGSTNFRK